MASNDLRDVTCEISSYQENKTQFNMKFTHGIGPRKVKLILNENFSKYTRDGGEEKKIVTGKLTKYPKRNGGANISQKETVDTESQWTHVYDIYYLNDYQTHYGSDYSYQPNLIFYKTSVATHLYFNSYSNYNNNYKDKISFYYKITHTEDGKLIIAICEKECGINQISGLYNDTIAYMVLNGDISSISLTDYRGSFSESSVTIYEPILNVFNLYKPRDKTYNSYINDASENYTVIRYVSTSNGQTSAQPWVIYKKQSNDNNKYIIYISTSSSYSMFTGYSGNPVIEMTILTNLGVNEKEILDSTNCSSHLFYDENGTPLYNNRICYSQLDENRYIKYEYFEDMFENDIIVGYNETDDKYELKKAHNFLYATTGNNVISNLKSEDATGLYIGYEPENIKISSCRIKNDPVINADFTKPTSNRILLGTRSNEYFRFEVDFDNHATAKYDGIYTIDTCCYEIKNGNSSLNDKVSLFSKYIYISKKTKFITENGYEFWYNKYEDRIKMNESISEV